MQNHPQRPSLSLLQTLGHLSEMSDTQLQALCERLTIQQAPAGSQLLAIGSADDANLFLLQGRVSLLAADGRESSIAHDDPSARHPLARLRPSRYEIRAIEPVSYLRISPQLIEQIKTEHAPAASELGYQVDEEVEIDSQPVENQLIYRLYEDLNSNRLSLPSLPEVAMKIGKAVSEDSTDAHRLAELLSNDPAMSAKLLKVANSPRFGGAAQIRTLPQAISRLGFRTVHNLVITFAMKELFRTKSQNLASRMDALWQHSRRVAAMAHVLSKQLPQFDPDFALLAGLIHDIGALVVINYARDYPETAEDPQHLAQAIEHLRGQLGKMIIHKWNLPDELADVVMLAEDWTRDTHEEPDYVDLIIIAQVHCYLSRNRLNELPPLSKIMAFHRLGFHPSAEQSLRLLKKSEKEIQHAEQLLAA